MNIWKKYELCEHTLKIRMPITLKVYEENNSLEHLKTASSSYLFFDEDTIILIQYCSMINSDIIAELKKFYVKFEEQSFELEEVTLQKRMKRGIQQGLLSFYINLQKTNRLYMVALTKQGSSQYLQVFTCVKEKVEFWKPIFDKILNSMEINV